MDLEPLVLWIVGIVTLVVLLVKALTDAGIKTLEELEKLREAWRRFREG
ncbi:hypothetical protein SUDANB32_03626 [Streptomyces sp. enrichment culture]